MDTVDLAIAGGGVAGLYTAWRVQSANPKACVRVFESSDRLGGRLYTEKVLHSSALAELGAMRFPQSHVLVTSLLSKLSIKVEPFPNLGTVRYYLRGKAVEVGQGGQPASPLPYNLAPGEPTNPDELLLAGLTRVVPKGLSFTPAEWDQFFRTSKFQGRPWWNWGYWNIISRFLSGEAYQLMEAAIGVESALANWNAQMSLPMLAVLLNDFIVNKFNRPANGWSELVNVIVGKIRAAQAESIQTEQKLRSVIRSGDPKYPLELVFRSGYRARAARVVLALPRRALAGLHIASELLERNPSFHQCLSRVAEIPAFKLYVSYESPWWVNAGGAVHGNCVTDLPLKQVFYGAGLGTGASTADQERVLMAAYSDFHGTEFWRGLIDVEKTPRMLMENPDPSSPALQAVESELRTIHGFTGELPKATSIGCATWFPDSAGAGWHAWHPGGDLNEWIPQIRQPFADAPLYICGEAFSDFQGWVEGALRSAEKLLESNFGLARPEWLPASVVLGP